MSTGCGWAAHVQTGIAGCFSVDEYDADVIKKHERTRKDKEDDRTRHIIELRAQTGPVFLILSGRSGRGRRCAARRPRRARYSISLPSTACSTRSGRSDAADTPRSCRRSRRCRRSTSPTAITALPAPRARDSSCAVRGGAGRVGHVPRGGISGRSDACAALQPSREGSGRSHAGHASLAALRQSVAVAKGGPAAPTRKGEVSMFLGGTWYTIGLGTASFGNWRRGGARREPPAGSGAYAAARRSATFAPTNESTSWAAPAARPRSRAAVSSGKAAVAFSMYPVSVADLMAISDAGGIMPPKSTWFEPKLRDGLLSHVI